MELEFFEAMITRELFNETKELNGVPGYTAVL